MLETSIKIQAVKDNIARDYLIKPLIVYRNYRIKSTFQYSLKGCFINLIYYKVILYPNI